MIGLLGRALSRDITVDSTELEDARWFPAADLRMMLERRHPDGLTTPNPYAIAHQLVRAALGS
jgi:NAD+ diphosphatase